MRSNLSNNDIIAAKRPGLKTGMDFSDLETGVENESQDLKNRAAHRHQEFPGPPPPQGLAVGFFFRLYDYDDAFQSDQI